jgi:hypothetical protein
MSFDQQLNKWITIDNQIKNLDAKLKILREQRNNTKNIITTYANNNKLVGTQINTPDGILKIAQVKYIPSLTYKYLEQKLKEVIPNTQQVEQILSHIKQTRNIQFIPEIKRISNK